MFLADSLTGAESLGAPRTPRDSQANRRDVARPAAECPSPVSDESGFCSSAPGAGCQTRPVPGLRFHLGEMEEKTNLVSIDRSSSEGVGGWAREIREPGGGREKLFRGDAKVLYVDNVGAHSCQNSSNCTSSAFEHKLHLADLP